jgi:hypothetical protein
MASYGAHGCPVSLGSADGLPAGVRLDRVRVRGVELLRRSGASAARGFALLPDLQPLDRPDTVSEPGPRVTRSVRPDEPAGIGARQTRAWLLLVGALAVHVIDETITDFLGFYNPLVLAIRSRAPWFPMPTFVFGVWLAGLVVLLLVLSALTPAVRRGARGTALASYVFAFIMFLNGLGHLVGSLYFQRWLPGATSAPLLLFAGVLLARRTWDPRIRWAGRDRRDRLSFEVP